MNEALDNSPVPRQQPRPKLSFCISTLNRCSLLAKTLDTILPQLTDECEVLVLDNASTDSTADVVATYRQRDDRIRYVRKNTEDDLDTNFDRAVELASGEYCWLFPDDDYVKPGAVSAVLKALRREPGLVLINYQCLDFTMQQVLQRGCLDFPEDRYYGAWELERLFIETRDFIRYIGTIVMRRSLWMERDRQLYFGSYFNFVGMVFQQRLRGGVHVIAEPYISYRSGNSHSFSPKVMELVFARWPSLIASLPLSEAAKQQLDSAYPWKHLHQLLIWRGAGLYSREAYRLWIRPQLRRGRHKLLPLLVAHLPGQVANFWMMLYFSARRRRGFRQLDSMYFGFLQRSPFNSRQRKSVTRPPAVERAQPQNR